MIFTSETKARKVTKLSYLGSINSNPKTIKNKKVSGNYTYIIYLAPYIQSGYNVCKSSTPECRLGCLATSGHCAMDIISGKNRISKCRINKTRLLFEEQDFFMDWMLAEIRRFQMKAKKDGYNFSVRLNGTSDIEWENIYRNGKNIFEHFPNVQFYDYTKSIKRIAKQIKNYYLTYSYTGRNLDTSIKLLNKGYNIAVVFNAKKNEKLPLKWKGYKVIDGDITDYRINDERGVVVGLHWKNIANKENQTKILNSMFVVKQNEIDCQV